MDKYEFNIKLDQIKKLTGKKDFKTASKIAKAMEWRKVKDWTTLNLIIGIHESAKDYEEARDIAILAYNRNLGGRRLVYKLTELFILLRDFSDAEELYREYSKMSQHDVNRYILLYKLNRAQNVSCERLINILEEYKQHEVDEKYLYELAELYNKAGRIEDCVKQCEDISLWFQDGKYVEKALRLKQKHSSLSKAQKQTLKTAEKQKEKSAEEAKREMFAQQKEKARILEDEIEEAFQEGRQEKPEQAVLEQEEPEKLLKTEDHQSGISMELIQNEAAPKESVNIFKTFITDMDAEQKTETDLPFGEEFLSGTPEQLVFQNLIEEEEIREKDTSINRVGQSIQELIRNAKRKIESNYEQVKKEDEEERIQEAADNIEIPVINYNLYDTQNIQRELAKNLGELMQEEEAEDVFKAVSEMHELSEARQALEGCSSVPTQLFEENPEEEEPEYEEQIEGQINLTDWLEAVQEEKYGKQSTKRFSKKEMQRILEKREAEKEEYERLIEKREQLKEEINNVYKEEARKDRSYKVIQAVRTDLAMRTGKATAKIEAEVNVISTAAKFSVILGKEALQEAEPQVNDTAHNMLREALREVAATDTQFEEMQEQILQEQILSEQSQEEQQTEDYEEKFITEAYEEYAGSFLIPKEVRKYFKRYLEMLGFEEQLGRYFEASKTEYLNTTSRTGNIIISGNRSSDKTTLAVNIVKALNTLYPDNPKKIAKTTGESINQKGIVKAMAKLKGTALIVEDAGSVEPKRIREMLELLEQDTEGMIVIFEDADTEINILLNVNPDISKKFNHRITLKQYTVNELVEMAKKYAGKRQHIVDDNALLQLYLRIDRLHSQVDSVKIDQVKEVIDKAIVKAEKRASKKLFGGIKKKRGEDGEWFFLVEADFKE